MLTNTDTDTVQIRRSVLRTVLAVAVVTEDLSGEELKAMEEAMKIAGIQSSYSVSIRDREPRLDVRWTYLGEE